MEKLLRKIVTLVLLISLIGSVAYTSSASTAKSKNDMISSFTYGNGTIETYEDSNSRLVKYFENNICIQEALLIKDTGDLYYNDISSKMYTSKSLDNLTVSNFNYVQKYNVSDFVTYCEKPESQSKGEGVSYSFIRSNSWYDDGVYHFARLYGGTDYNVYSTKYWYLAAGTAVSLVLSILFHIYNIEYYIELLIPAAGGFILSSILAVEWYRDNYWKYMINQVYPTTDRFTAYSSEFVYQTMKRYTLNNGDTEWEQIYYSNYYDGSSAFCEELVNNIPYYFIF